MGCPKTVVNCPDRANSSSGKSTFKISKDGKITLKSTTTYLDGKKYIATIKKKS